MTKPLQIALISGPAYDPLYVRLEEFTKTTGIEINVAFTGDHPALNRHLASLDHVNYDLVSTHTKYAPSQLDFLAPLDDLIEPDHLADFAPILIELTRIGGKIYGLPRNIDVRLLHYRTDLIKDPPATWDELFDTAKRLNLPPDLYGFIFAGRDSGLFGTFYELAEMAGASLFPENMIPDIENDAGRWALDLLCRFYREGIVPGDLTSWHFEEVHACFRDGHAAMVGDFPGYYSLYRDPGVSEVSDRFAVCPYPVGPAGHSLAYGGSHTFALTRKGVENPDAFRMLLFLTGYDSQLFEAVLGSTPVRRSVMAEMLRTADQVNGERLVMLREVIIGHILIPPKLAYFPEIEEVLWETVQQAMIGKISVDNALESMRRQIRDIVAAESGAQSSEFSL